jgi:hypothetical protein
MPVVNGRLVCCVCGSDLGDADDPYRDPTCGYCIDRENDADILWEAQIHGDDEKDDGSS